MNKFEIRYLHSAAEKKEKRMSFFRSLIKSVNVGANGTQDYVVKKGSGRNKIASTRWKLFNSYSTYQTQLDEAYVQSYEFPQT